ncbi:unnamed protein product [Clavelina lepadiformis]|uniref:Uncharacterized protein n=1 Tax=Clavelina lepadiformis TaxID=159417 RepID=A0ABP0H367_CLALP
MASKVQTKWKNVISWILFCLFYTYYLDFLLAEALRNECRPIHEEYGQNEFRVNCQSLKLTSVPRGISTMATHLFLDHNQIMSLNSTSFAELNELETLTLKGNRISTVAPDTFHTLHHLRQLDLSYNFLVTVPDSMLCPWTPPKVAVKLRGHTDDEMVLCPVNRSAFKSKKLMVRVDGNPWHCTCYLQEFFSRYLCPSADNDPCMNFSFVRRSNGYEDRDIGHCATPSLLNGLALQRLKTDADGQKTKTIVNLCVERQIGPDYALLVVILVWMGIMVIYVVHFVSWNNREISHHKNYIASLERCKEPKGQFEIASRPTSSYVEKEEKPDNDYKQSKTGLAINNTSLEKEDAVETCNTATLVPKPSPVWKPRKKRQLLRKTLSS